MLWHVRPALAFARHHHRIAFSTLASTADRLTPACTKKNGIQLLRLHNAQFPVNVMTRYSAFPTTKRFMVSNEHGGDVRFQPGDKIQVEVVNFGPLGASVEVIGLGHGDDVPLLPADAPEAYGYGLVLQKEISYFRSARNNIDVVRGEILPAYVQKVRPEDGKLDVSLRSFGGKSKSLDTGTQILERLEEVGGRLDIGEKSTPQEINDEFPGVSKSVFKKVRIHNSDSWSENFDIFTYFCDQPSIMFVLLIIICLYLIGARRFVQERIGKTRQDIHRIDEVIISQF